MNDAPPLAPQAAVGLWEDRRRRISYVFGAADGEDFEEGAAKAAEMGGIMTIEAFLLENEVDRGKDPVDVGTLEAAERIVNVKFGEALTEYLLRYGYLAYESVELYGMNARLGLDSNLVKQTLYLHKYFPKTKGCVALENRGEGDYYVVNGEDEVLEYDTGLKELIPTNLTLFAYILQRFEEEKEENFV